MPRKVWFNGSMVDYDKLRVPLLNHSLQYGSGIFEGIRSYSSGDKVFVFRLREHMERFHNTAKIYRMNLRYTTEELEKAVVETVRENELKDSYIRPFAFYESDEISLFPSNRNINVAIAAIPFGKYFGEKASKGVRCKTSSWERINSRILPVRAKASGNYLNSVISGLEAISSGYDEAILLSGDGYVAEGPGENVFAVSNGKLITPGPESSILSGITRESIKTISKDMGIEVVERLVLRDDLYLADEVFFCGTAAEVTPIIEIDGIKIGDGKPGEISKRLGKELIDAATGKIEKYRKWLTPVY
ncbi:MAG: branched-chain amino acid transaminase [Thermoplasmataceae archaeon]